MTLSARRAGRLALLLVPIAVAVVAAVVVLADDDDGTPRRAAEQVDAAEPTYSTLDDLVAASDAVVAGTVVDVGEGRSITDPADATAGIRTRLVSIGVEEVLAGRAASSIVVEQEAALLDGTPIEVNGVPAFTEAEQGIYFLVAGEGEEFPYYALVNRQARYAVDGDRLVAPADDPLTNEIAAMTPRALRCAVSDTC